MENSSGSSEEDSIDYDEYVIEDDVDAMTSTANEEEIKNAKTKMNRTVAKKVTGLLKGFFNKASTKVKSSLYRKNVREEKDRVYSKGYTGELNKINLLDEPLESYRHSVYTVSLGGMGQSYHERGEKFNDLIPDEVSQKVDLSKSVNCPPSPMREKVADNQQPNEDSDQHNKPLLYEEVVDPPNVEDIDEELTYIDEDEEESVEKSTVETHPTKMKYKDNFLIKKSNEGSNNIINQEKDTSSQANQIVEQMKELLIAQFKQNMLNDKRTHYGIACSECKVEPIVGVRYKCAICIEFNLCELCEINNSHEHIFIKVKTRGCRIPMFSELKRMVSKFPREETKSVIRENKMYPCLALDISCAFGNQGVPMKSSKDIKKANLVQLADKEFMDNISIREIEGEDSVNSDLLITNKWILKNESEEEWPENKGSLILKCLSNDCLIKLRDINVTEKEMKPIVLSPNETGELKVHFILPHRIRLAAAKTKKTVNIIFSLFDTENKQFVGANLPCTIPL